jgi:hypothetical protein
MWPNTACVVAAAFIDDVVWEVGQLVSAEMADAIEDKVKELMGETASSKPAATRP